VTRLRIPRTSVISKSTATAGNAISKPINQVCCPTAPAAEAASPPSSVMFPDMTEAKTPAGTFWKESISISITKRCPSRAINASVANKVNNVVSGDSPDSSCCPVENAASPVNAPSHAAPNRAPQITSASALPKTQPNANSPPIPTMAEAGSENARLALFPERSMGATINARRNANPNLKRSGIVFSENNGKTNMAPKNRALTSSQVLQEAVEISIS